MWKIPIYTGEIFIDEEKCRECTQQYCVEACQYQILGQRLGGPPRLELPPEDVKRGKCVECLACELACAFHGRNGLTIQLPLPAEQEGDA